MGLNINNVHSVHRAQERFNLSQQDIKDMQQAIRHGESMPMGAAKGKDREYHLVWHGHRAYLVVYQTRKYIIITVLPDGYRIK